MRTAGRPPSARESTEHGLFPAISTGILLAPIEGVSPARLPDSRTRRWRLRSDARRRQEQEGSDHESQVFSRSDACGPARRLERRGSAGSPRRAAGRRHRPRAHRLRSAHDLRRHQRASRERRGRSHRPGDDAVQEERSREAHREDRRRAQPAQRHRRAARLDFRRPAPLPRRAGDLRQPVVLDRTPRWPTRPSTSSSSAATSR